MKIAESQQPTINFLRHFKGLFDHRQARKVQYPLDEVLLLVLCAVISGADSWVEVATWGKKKLDFLRRFFPYANGTPSHDQLSIIFAVLDAAQFQQCFIDWVASLKQAVQGVVAIEELRVA